MKRNAGADAIIIYRVRDQNPPEWGWMEMHNIIISALKRGDRVAISCHGGHGRTGTVIAAIWGLHRPATETDDPILHIRQALCGQMVESYKQVDWLHAQYQWPPMTDGEITAAYFPKRVFTPLAGGQVTFNTQSDADWDKHYDSYDHVPVEDVRWTNDGNNSRPYALIDDAGCRYLVRLYHHTSTGVDKYITLRDCRTPTCKGLFADCPEDEVNYCLTCGSEEIIAGNRLDSAHVFWNQLVKEGILTITPGIRDGKVFNFYQLAPEYEMTSEEVVASLAEYGDSVADDAPAVDSIESVLTPEELSAVRAEQEANRLAVLALMPEDNAEMIALADGTDIVDIPGGPALITDSTDDTQKGI